MSWGSWTGGWGYDESHRLPNACGSQMDLAELPERPISLLYYTKVDINVSSGNVSSPTVTVLLIKFTSLY